MAGETRRQRRDARRAESQDVAAPRPRAPQPADAGTGAVVAAPPAQRGGFIRESIGELRKVEWPTRNQVIQGTIVVIFACAVIGAFLWGCDQVFRPFVRDVLLGQ